MPDPVYWFDPSVGAYITNDGEWVTLKDLVAQGQASLAASSAAIDDMAGLVANGQLSADAWYGLMQEEIKQEVIVQYILGHGGMVDDMTHADWGRIGAIVKDQYKYLKGFRDDIIAGNLTEGQISSRAGMYINSAREAFNNARGRVMADAGNDEEKWVLGNNEDHCIDCQDNADQDWQPIGTFPDPGSGSTVCLTNCGCALIYRNSVTGQEEDSDL